MQALSRRYGDLLAVDNVSSKIGPGEVVGLLGHNGAGKTTVMKMLTGYLEASSGSITIDGHPMATQRHLIQKQLGYLPENCPVYYDMTVVGFLAFRADMMGVPRPEQPRAIRAALAHTGLADRASETIRTLSRGLRQRVGVAQAILHKPRIVILDEPTNGLDPEQIEEMRHLIRSLAERATVIISTHVLSEVEAVCERVLILCRGRLALDARLAELNRTAALRLEVAEAGPKLPATLESLEGVSAVATIEPGSLRLATEGDMQKVAARVADAVHDLGLPLHRLAPEARSLEAVFREVNEKSRKEMIDA